MTLSEYYGFPKGINAQMRYASFYTEQDDDYPCPANMNNAFAYQTMTFIKPLNTSNVTNMSYMFNSCPKLTTAPLMDTSNVTSMVSMFYSCSELTDVPSYNTSNVTTMEDMFNYCKKLTTISPLDTSKVTNMDSMFYSCDYLITIPPLDTSNVTTMNQMFYSCPKLTTIPPLNCSKISSKNYYPVYSYNNYTYLTEVGGFINMKMSWDNTYGLAKCPNLTYESCINILNGLYDFTGNSQTPNSSQGKLKVHANFLTTVGDELSIGTEKGWTITT